MAWQSQIKNIGTRVKLVVFYADDQPIRSKTYHAFKTEEDSGKAVQNMTRRILQGVDFGRYKTAIFYDNGIEVEKYIQGIKQ